jgi:hypothetical protein
VEWRIIHANDFVPQQHTGAGCGLPIEHTGHENTSLFVPVRENAEARIRDLAAYLLQAQKLRPVESWNHWRWTFAKPRCIILP